MAKQTQDDQWLSFKTMKGFPNNHDMHFKDGKDLTHTMEQFRQRSRQKFDMLVQEQRSQLLCQAFQRVGEEPFAMISKEDDDFFNSPISSTEYSKNRAQTNGRSNSGLGFPDWFCQSADSTPLTSSASGFPRFPSFGGFPRASPLLLSPPHMKGRTASHISLHASRASFHICGVGGDFGYHCENRSISSSLEDSEAESDEEEDPFRPPRPLPLPPSPFRDDYSISNTSQDNVPALSVIKHMSNASETDESSIPTDSPRGSMLAIEASPASPAAESTPKTRMDKAFKVANELLVTERSYVNVLHLIDQVFQFRVDQENRAHPMFPPEIIPQMFSNVKSIFKLHHDFLLPQLEERMKNWEKHKKIGDLMKNFAPFLKMYTEYVKNFDQAMNLINAMHSKNQRFATIMDEIQCLPESGGLSVQHHMLSPIQRVPRYQLLIQEYLRRLADDSPDREDTKISLHLVSTAASHANEAMRKIEQFRQLLDIQEKVIGLVDLVAPSRVFIKEGRIAKISARSGDHQERYLFLLSDLLLLCSSVSRVIPGSSNHFRLRARFQLNRIQVLEGDNLETAHSFYIRDSCKSVELYTHTSEEKDSWMSCLSSAIEELERRKASLRVGDVYGAGVTDGGSEGVGRKPPPLLKAEGVGRCMDCAAPFSMMRRKHHCRACGTIVCSKCSNQRHPLPYEESGKPSRVCRDCYEVLSSPNNKVPNGDSQSDGPSRESIILSDGFSRKTGLLEVPADVQCVQNGYLQLLNIRTNSHRGSKGSNLWTKRWFALHPDFVLYSFESHTDLRALTATPLPGFTVTSVRSDAKNETGVGEKERDRALKMFHAHKAYCFLAEDINDRDRWVEVLQLAAKAELPPTWQETNDSQCQQ